MHWGEQEMEGSNAKSAQVIETGKIRAETKRQVMREDRTCRQEEKSPDGQERCPLMGTLTIREV